MLKCRKDTTVKTIGEMSKTPGLNRCLGNIENVESLMIGSDSN